jgi:hypothetical protein
MCNWHDDGVSYSCEVRGSASMELVITSDPGGGNIRYTLYINGAKWFDINCNLTSTTTEVDNDYGSYNVNELFFQLFGLAFFDGFRSGNTVTGTVDGVMVTGTFTITKQ